MKDLIVSIDLIVNNFFQKYQNIDSIILLMKFFSFLANWKTLAILSLIIVFLLWKKSKLSVYVFVAGFFLTNLIVLILKNIFKRIRPEGIINETGFSFPSGHTANGIFFYGFMIYFSYKYLKNPLKTIIIIPAIILGIFSGISRLFLGIHWLSDILASIIISGTILIISMTIIENKNNNF